MYDIYSLGRLTLALMLLYCLYFLQISFYQKLASYFALFGLFIWQFALFVLTLEDEVNEEHANSKILDTISDEIGEVKLDAFGNIPPKQMLSIYKICS